jgi:hypothetical protein
MDLKITQKNSLVKVHDPHWGFVCAGQVVLCQMNHASRPALFVLIIFEIGYYFLPGACLNTIILFMLPAIAGMTGVCHHAQIFLLRWSFMSFFGSSWPGIMILLISASETTP